jgi:hypothetical protein
MSARSAGALVAVVLGCFAAGPAYAQYRFTGDIAVTASRASVERETAAGVENLSGTAFGAEAAVGYWLAELRGRYVQGSLSAEGGSDAGDLVEGELLLGVRPIEAFQLRVGPHARSYVTPTGTTRWVQWEVHGRFEAPLLLDGSLRSYLEGWYALSGDVNAPTPFQVGRGLEGGVGIVVPRTRIRVHLAYRVDRGALETDARTETVEQIQLRVGIGR